MSPADFDYEFDAWHLGAIVWGHEAEKTALVLAEFCGCYSLHVPRDHETVWMWLSSGDQARLTDLERILIRHIPTQISVAIGEPRTGVEGWRLTHREAQMALQVTLQMPQRFTRCRDVVLLAVAMRDDTLSRSLLDTYIRPVEKYGGASQSLFDALRAYFAAGGNAIAAAGSLDVTRHTIQRRIRTVEQAIGRPLHTCYPELYVALQIYELSRYQGQREDAPSQQVLAPS